MKKNKRITVKGCIVLIDSNIEMLNDDGTKTKLIHTVFGLDSPYQIADVKKIKNIKISFDEMP